MKQVQKWFKKLQTPKKKTKKNKWFKKLQTPKNQTGYEKLKKKKSLDRGLLI